MENSAPFSRPSWLVLAVIFVLGLLIGGWTMRDIRPRSVFAADNCTDGGCFRVNELTELAAAIGIQRVPNILPYVVFQTDKTIVFSNPLPEAKYHYIIVPKRDIKSSQELGPDDQIYLIDAYAAMNRLIREKGLKTYLIKTNGPGYQDVGYLHFHLIGEN